ncbi:MAG: Clp protease ClpP [Clostridia bacterium]|nr:Clp protease ClpP [Clostridia bacterium]
MKKKYYSMAQTGNVATINIYGDITSFPWFEGDVSASNLSRQLEELTDVTEINVYINSYGGEVAEGLAIYNALKRHKAKVNTYCDGFACSIASVIFMAGEERVMGESSLLMIHNAWSYVCGNADEMRKQAEDLDKITQASVIAYKSHSTLSEEEIKELLDNETWLLPEEALEYGFATSIEKTETENTSQNARMSLLEIIKQHRQEVADDDEEEDPEDEGNPDDDEGEPDDEGNEGEDTDEDEDPEKQSEEETEEEETEDEEDEATQKLCVFFNALSKL